MSTTKRISFPSVDKQATYTVSSQTKQGDKQQQIRYTTTIRKDDGWTRTHYQVSRSPQELTPVVDNPYVEALALTTTLWRELKLSIDESGQIRKIVNLEAIQQYWEKELRFKLTEIYVGDPIEGIINQLDQLIQDEQRFIAKIGRDTFFYYWLKHDIGEYIQYDQAGDYIKVGRPNHHYQIEDTSAKGILVKGKGIKSVEELNKLREEWKLSPTASLDYEEDYSCEYNNYREIVKLSRKEVYTYQGSIYRSAEVEIIKK